MRLSAALSYFAFCGMAFLIVFNLGPLLETKFNPVFSKFEIVNVDPHPNGVDSLMTVRFYKLRNCAPMGFAWHNGDFGNYTIQLNVASNRSNPAPSLPVGRGTATYTVQGLVLKAVDIPNLHAETFSRCHPFWVTRSEIYP